MIDKVLCASAVDSNPNLSFQDRERYLKMCEDGLSIAALYRLEIPTKGTCTIEDAEQYIREEQPQMQQHFGVPYDLDKVSVAEHVLNEDVEGDHNGLPKGYGGVPGDVKFFLEWLEGHHPSLACQFGGSNEVPSDRAYAQIASGGIEAFNHRHGTAMNKPQATSMASLAIGGK